MWKIFFLVLALFFNGCSYFKFNATMCENMASDPHSIVPPECINYVEKDAQKAFENNKNSKDESSNLIEFNDKSIE